MKIIVSPLGPINRVNPFFGSFVSELEALGNTIVAPRPQHVLSADVFHLHFPDFKMSLNKNPFKAVATSVAMLAFIAIARLRGRPVVWMVHDVHSLHSYHPRLTAIYMACVRKMISGYIFLSQSSRREFERLYPGERTKPSLQIMHPTYKVRLLSKEEKNAVREKLGVKPDEFLVGYLGGIKLHKNPTMLRHIPERLDDGRQTVLLVAGKASNIEEDNEYEKHMTHGRLIRIKERISDEELEAYAQASDAVLLPYNWGWNSGSLFLILACGQKALTSNLPIFTEMRQHFGDKWITTYDLSANEKGAVGKAVNDIAKITCSEGDTEKLAQQMQALSFDRLASKIQRFYKSFVKAR